MTDSFHPTPRRCQHKQLDCDPCRWHRGYSREMLLGARVVGETLSQTAERLAGESLRAAVARRVSPLREVGRVNDVLQEVQNGAPLEFVGNTIRAGEAEVTVSDLAGLLTLLLGAKRRKDDSA